MYLLVYAALIGAMWFFLFRPQKKQQEQLRKLRDSLVVGEQVTTIGGIIGEIVAIDDEQVELITAETTKLVFRRTAIASRLIEPATDPVTAEVQTVTDDGVEESETIINE